jgi:hypothetical protein
MGSTTECQSLQEYIAGGPSAKVATSSTGPPEKRNGTIAASIPIEQSLEQFGLITKIRAMSHHSVINRPLQANSPRCGLVLQRSNDYLSLILSREDQA